MTLSHDAQGFLTGEIINDIRRAGHMLNRIRNDVAEIRQALQRAARGAPRPNRSVSGPAASGGAMPAQPQPRTGPRSPSLSGSVSPGRRSGPSRAAGSGSSDLPASSPSLRQPAGRNAQPNRDGRGRFTSNGDRSEADRHQRKLFGEMADRIVGAVNGAGQLEQIDPTVKAFNEVAQPLVRGYQLLASGDKPTRWYRRLFGELRLFRKEQTVFNRAEQRALHEIDENTERTAGGSGTGGSSFLGGLLGGGVSGITARLLPLLMGGLSAVFAPVGLAVAGAATAAWGLFTEDGRKFFANVADKLYMAWYESTEYLKKQWDAGVQSFTSIWEPIGKFFSDKFGIVSDVANKANVVVKEHTGVDVKAGVQSAVEGAKAAYQGTMNALGNAKDWVLGQTSRMFESGKGGAGTVSSGRGDFGGASYGTYQLSSKQGTLQAFLKSSNYGNQFKGLTPGTDEFNRRWKAIAQNDPRFGDAQHDFIKRTHYDPEVAKLQAAGIDISGRGQAVQDAVWSTAVQFGSRAARLIQKALKGKDASSITDADFVSAVQDYKIAHNNRLFSRSSDQIRAGTLNRAVQEKASLLRLASTPAASAAPLPSLVTPVMSKPLAIPDTPNIDIPLASAGGRDFLSINIDHGEVGQDLSDRRLAHIVTGGLSS